MGPYQLLLCPPSDFNATREAKAIIEFACQVYQAFHDGLRIAAHRETEYDMPFLLMSFDKISLGDPPAITEEHIDATSSGAVGTFFCFDNDMPMKAVEVLEALDRNEQEVKISMITLLITLRRDYEEGSRDSEHQLEVARSHLKAAMVAALWL